MSRPRTFYVLGAGTSYGLIPTTEQMRAVIKRDYDAFGIYPTTRSPRSVLHDRVIGRCTRASNDFHEILLQNIQLGALEFLVQKALYLPSEAIAPPHYAVFDIVGSPATLFSFNLDGLAHTFCRNNHVVLEPHGRIDRLWFENDKYEFWCEATIAFDVTLPHVNPKLLPSPEPTYLTQTRTFEMARHLFRRSPAMLIIGYSFGNISGRFDDSASWQFFLDLLTEYPRPTFVLSPFPEELTDILRQSLSSNNVFSVPVYWETFATCLIAVAGPSRKLPPTWSEEQFKDFIYQYERSVDNR